ncbi:MAG: sulfurtransferase TusA family protein [bacterium]
MIDKTQEQRSPYEADIIVDAYGLLCPLPVIKASNALKACPSGSIIEVIATDTGAPNDLKVWAAANGYIYLGAWSESRVYHIFIKKPESPSPMSPEGNLSYEV